MPGVGKNGIMLHLFEMPCGNDVAAAGSGNKNIADRCCLIHSHNAESVHYRFKCAERIYFRNNNICAQSFCAHCNAV